jgi:hypothetical protein
VDVTYAPNNLFTGVYLNSDLVSNVGANGSGSLATSASLLLLNNTTASNSGTVGNLYNFKVYNPLINLQTLEKTITLCVLGLDYHWLYILPLLLFY